MLVLSLLCFLMPSCFIPVEWISSLGLMDWPTLKWLSTANKQIKELIRQCIKKKKSVQQSVNELYRRWIVVYMLVNVYPHKQVDGDCHEAVFFPPKITDVQYQYMFSQSVYIWVWSGRSYCLYSMSCCIVSYVTSLNNVGYDIVGNYNNIVTLCRRYRKGWC